MEEKYLPGVEKLYELGASFTPLRGKVPISPAWASQPRAGLEESLLWARASNIGLRTGSNSGGIVVVDVEAEAEPGAFEALGLPPTLSVRTGRGGWHYYYRANGHRIKNSAGKIEPKIDIRGEGGQVVFPGSIHPVTGKPYEFVADPASCEIAALPQEFIDKYASRVLKDYKPPAPKPAAPVAVFPGSHPYIKGALEKGCHKVASATEGTRNDTLNSEAFSLGGLVGTGSLNRSDVESGLLAAALQCGLPEHEARAAIRSGLEAGIQHPRELPESVTNPQRERQPRDEDVPAFGHNEEVEIPPEYTETGASPPAPDEEGPPIDGPPPYYDQDNVVLLFFRLNERILYYRDILYRYNGRCYRPMTDNEARARLVKFIQGELSHRTLWMVDDEGSAVAQSVNPKASFLNQAIDAIKGFGVVDYSPDIPFWVSTGRPAVNHVGVENGILDLDSYELMPHNPDCFTLAALPYAYDPNATCPRFMEFLDYLFIGDEGKMAVIQEIFGYCLQSSQDGQKIFVFIGEGKNGKSVTARILKMLIGEDNCSSVPLEHLDKEHATAALVGKMVNFSMEWKYLEIAAEGTLKAISGGDPVGVNPKHKAAFQTMLPTKFVVISNEPPHIQDRTQGMWRRICVLPFSRVIPEDRRVNMGDLLEVIGQEMSGILNFALEGLKQFRMQKGFTETEEMTLARDLYRRGGSPILTWIEDGILANELASYPATEAYKDYSEWCKINGHKPLNSTHFGIEISRWYKREVGRDLKKKRIQGAYYYEGICPQADSSPPTGFSQG